jgi:hypothetical protein
VHVVRHQAVHENCKASRFEEVGDLRGQLSGQTRIGEPPQTARRAYGDEIAARATVIEAGNTWRRVRHASKARTPDATEQGGLKTALYINRRAG